MGDKAMTDADIQELLKRFAAPLAKYAAISPDRKDLANVLVRCLWAAMIAGPEMEVETWKSFQEVAHLSEDGLKAIQDCYNQEMKPVVTQKQLVALRKRFGVQRKR